MDIIGSRDTLKIVERTLSRVDPRLLDHGSRVAYLVYRLLSRAEDLSAPRTGKPGSGRPAS